MKSTVNHMRGASLIGTLLTVTLFLLFAYIAVRLIPSYVDDYQINLTIQTMAQDPSMKDLTKEELREFFSKRLQFNNVRNFDLNKLQIERKQNVLTYTVDYETRTHMMGNIDAVLVFRDRAQSE